MKYINIYYHHRQRLWPITRTSHEKQYRNSLDHSQRPRGAQYQYWL